MNCPMLVVNLNIFRRRENNFDVFSLSLQVLMIELGLRIDAIAESMKKYFLS